MIKDQQEEKTYYESRLEMGEAYMFCNNCGARLYSFDGDKDASRNCPKLKGSRCAYDE